MYFYLALAYDNDRETEKALETLDDGLGATYERDKEAYARLLTKKSEILYEQHMYACYTAVGEEVAELEEDPGEKAARIVRLAYAYYQVYNDEKAGEMFERAFDEFAGLSEEEKAPHIRRLYDNYAEFLRFAKHDPEAGLEYNEKAFAADAGIVTPGRYAGEEQHMEAFRARVRLARAYRYAGQDRKAENLSRNTLAWRSGGKGMKRLFKGSSAQYGSACSDFMIGECLYGIRDYSRAIEFLERAVVRAKEDSGCPKGICFEALFTLMLIAMAKGDKEAAKVYYRQVLDIAPDRDYCAASSLFE